MFKITDTVGRKDRKELRYSQASATKRSLWPMRRVPPMEGSSPPTMTVGSRDAAWVKVAIMAVVEVLPWVPATHTTRR